MTGNEDETLIWSEENPTLKICLNCSTPQKASQLTGHEIEKLNCVFKLNYLTPFDSSSLVQDEEWLLCQDCQQLLNHLYQLYNNFLQVSKVESYLTRQLVKLQKIIQSHQDKTINCDLIVPEQESDLFSNQDDDAPNCPFNYELIERKVIVPSTSTLIPREPRVLLERLPSKYLNIKTPSHQNEEETKDDYLQPEIKIEVDDDAEDDDFIPHEDDANSEEYLQNSKRKRTKIKSSPEESRKSTQTKKPKVEDNYPLIERIAKPIKNSSSQSKGKKEDLRRASFKDYRRERFKYANPCWYCKLHFDSIDLLLDHTRQDHVPQSRTCSIDKICDRCARICTSDSSFATHLKKCELIPLGVTLPKNFMCHMCSMSFGTRDRLTSHLKIHSSDLPFACDLCDFKTRYRDSLRKHKTTHEISTQTFKCDQCDVICKNNITLKMHKNRKHTQKGFARYRERQDAVLARLKEETRLKRLTVSTICVDCNIDFNSRLALFNHRNSLHGENLRQFVCDQCGQFFSRKKSLQGHLRIVHSNARPFLCQKCGKSYKDAQGLRNHEKTTHTEEGRLKHNQRVREYNQRRKNIKAQLEFQSQI